MKSGGLCRWPPNTFGWNWDNDGRRIDAEFNGNSTRHHSNTFYFPTYAAENALQPSTMSLAISSVSSGLFDIKIASW